MIVSLGTAYEEGRTMDAYSNFQLPVELFSHIDQYSESIHPDSYLSNAQSDCQQKLKEMTSKLSSLDVSLRIAVQWWCIYIHCDSVKIYQFCKTQSILSTSLCFFFFRFVVHPINSYSRHKTEGSWRQRRYNKSH